jgi:hypothetical protein
VQREALIGITEEGKFGICLQERVCQLGGVWWEEKRIGRLRGIRPRSLSKMLGRFWSRRRLHYSLLPSRAASWIAYFPSGVGSMKGVSKAHVG